MLCVLKAVLKRDCEQMRRWECGDGGDGSGSVMDWCTLRALRFEALRILLIMRRHVDDDDWLI